MTGSQYPQQPSQQPQYQQPPPYQQPPYQQPQPIMRPPPKPKSNIGAIVVVLIVVIIVIIAIGAVFLFAGLSSHATLKVRVNSSHIFHTVQYELYIDGSLEDSDNLAAGYYVEYTFDLYPGSDCHTYNVYASSTGGGLGAESDSENVYLCAGETKSVNLYI